MTLWIAAALLTVGAVMLLLVPLVRRHGAGRDRADYDLRVYEDQLAEVGRDLSRGLIDQTQAGAARTEISRRILALSTPDGAPAPPHSGGRALALALAVLVPVAALAIYLPSGRPDLPGQPFAQRDSTDRADRQEMVAAAEALRRQIDAAPADPVAWVELAGRFQALGRAREAADAYARAVGLTGGDPLLTGLYAEALVEAGNGMVTEQARLAFDAVLAALPGDPRARYFLALGRAQAGDDLGALAQWQALAADSPADASWQPVVRQQIVRTAERLGLDPAAQLPEPRPARAASGADRAGLGAAAAMTDDEGAAMVRGMVDGLADRLEREPDDLEGWLRLADSYQVLDEPDRAADAMARAAALAPEDAGVLTAYSDALLQTTAGQTLSADFMAVMERLLELDGDNIKALWFLGVRALADSRPREAEALWQRLLAQLEPGTPEYDAVRDRLDSLTPAEGG